MNDWWIMNSSLKLSFLEVEMGMGICWWRLGQVVGDCIFSYVSPIAVIDSMGTDFHAAINHRTEAFDRRILQPKDIHMSSNKRQKVNTFGR